MLTGREIFGWSGAAALVVAAHVGVSYGFAALMPPPAPEAALPAMEVELMPLVVSEAEAIAVETVEETEQQVEEVAEVAPELLPEEVSESTEETPSVEQPEEIVETPEKTVVPAPVAKRPEVVMPRRQPKPVKKAERKIEPKPKPKLEKPKPVRQAAKPTPTKAENARPRSEAKPKAPAANPSRWYGQVQAAVLSRKPKGKGASGSVVVRFVVSASGAVTSASISRSSGNAELDGAALNMVRGARIPRPPDGLGRSTFPFSVPVRFQ